MKVLCILYDDPKGGMPARYPVETLPKIEKYPDTFRFLAKFPQDILPAFPLLDHRIKYTILSSITPYLL